MLRVQLLIFISLLSILVNGCSNTNEKTNATINNQKETISVSTILGIHNDELYDSKNNWFKIDNNTAFSPYITLGNDFPHDNTYRLFFFLDYKQISIEYNNQSKNFLELKMQERSEENIKINIKNLPEGNHDFMVVSMRNSNNYINKNDFIPGEEVYLYQRKKIIVGKNKEQQINFSKLNVDNTDLDGSLIITKNLDDKYQDQVNTITKEELPKSWLRIPVEKDNSHLAIIAIAGEKQLKIKHPYIEVNGKGTVSIPLSDIQNIEELSPPQNLTFLVLEDDFSNTEDRAIFTNKITINNK